MIKNYYPRLYSRWYKFLHSRALNMKHPNPDNFALKGWRLRAGGKGLDYYKTAIESAPCTLSDSATSYQLLSGDVRNINNFLRPLGPQTHIVSDEYSEIFLIHEVNSKEIIASVEIGFEDKAIRINYLLKKNVRLFRQRVEKQLRKLQSCIYCGSCATKCSLKAIYICETSVKVDNEKCISCLECVSFDCPAFKSLFYR